MTELSNAPTKRPSLHYIALGALFVIAILYQARLTPDIIQGERVDVPFFSVATANLDVVSPEAERAGLHRGDTLLAINGQPYTGTAMRAQAFVNAKPGDTIRLTVRTKSRVREIDLSATAGVRQPSKVAFDLLLNVVMPIGCILLGSWVVLMRPRDKLAWLLLGLLLCFSQVVGPDYMVESWGPGLRESAMIYHMGLAVAWPIFMFLFGFFFPEPFPFFMKPGAWRRWVPWIVIAPLIADGIAQVVVAAWEISNYAAVEPLYRAVVRVDSVVRLYAYCVVGFGFFTSIFMKSAMATSRDASRRLQLLYWGTTAAILPLFVVTLSAWIRGKSMYEVFPHWAVGGALLAVVLFPLTLAYVIVVQRAMDVRVVIRQGLQYGLAKTGIRVLQFIAIGIVIATAFALGSNSNRVGKTIVIAVAVTIGFTIPRLGDRLRLWTDRRFFREAYNTEQVLSELSDQVRGMVETRPLIETVAARLSETLHVPKIAVVLAAHGAYQPACALGYGSSPDVTFPADTGLPKALEKHKEPARVYLDNPESWLYREPELSDEDRRKLVQLQSELLLPLSARDKLLGFISLGPKRSEEPYSGTDLRLLKSVAAQTGLALENARLMSAIAEEVAQRERLNREVEIAREVQERLFPQVLPPIIGIEYAGACRPALGVGGDYYDFLALPGGQLGIAIGDVAGKGIAAALMMASLQASLRGEATRAPENLAALVANVNRLVYEASSANRYATFFYAQYNPACRKLTYVNAGHNPPMLFHCAEGKWQLQRLETGGTVIGLLESFPYEQATLSIDPGDLFVAFTDGISEAMNSHDEEWGEQKLIDTVTRCTRLSPQETISRIMQAADEFVAGARQHDDMTLVVLRATG
jgi:phosphoserine phosphatase RsbU/P